jgi:hypothetical protein
MSDMEMRDSIAEIIHDEYPHQYFHTYTGENIITYWAKADAAQREEARRIADEIIALVNIKGG